MFFMIVRSPIRDNVPKLYVLKRVSFIKPQIYIVFIRLTSNLVLLTFTHIKILNLTGNLKIVTIYKYGRINQQIKEIKWSYHRFIVINYNN